MLLFVDIRRGGASSQTEIGEEENSSENDQNSGESGENVDNSGELSTEDGSDSSGSSESEKSGAGTASGSDGSASENGSGSEEGEVKAETALDIGSVYTEDYWISDSSYMSESWSGSGTESDPYRISSAADLALLSYMVFTSTVDDDGNETFTTYSGCYFKQTANINLSGHYWMPIGRHCSEGVSTGHYFAGVYNGKGFNISGITTYYNDSADDLTIFNYAGLFGYASGGEVYNLNIIDSTIMGYNYVGVIGYSSGCDIHDLCFTNSSIEGYSYVGGIVGSVTASCIHDCYNNGCVLGDYSYVGGIIGYGRGNSGVRLEIYDCHNSGTVEESYNYVGGIIGYFQYYSDIHDCYNEGSVVGYVNFGGIVGYSAGLNYENYNNIYNCYNVGNVGSEDSTSRVGGILGYGYAYTNVFSCFNTGDIVGTYDVGGLIGYIRSASIGYLSYVYDCYNSGGVTGTSYGVGGVIGNLYNYSCAYNCYNTGTVTGVYDVGGVVGDVGFRTVYAYVYNCFNVGDVTATSTDSSYYNCVGGVAGYFVSGGTIANCYYGGCTITGNTTTYSKGVGYDGSTSAEGVDSDGVTTNLTNITTLAKTESWFTDSSNWNSSYTWDFENTWIFPSKGYNDGYPILRGFWNIEYDASADYWYYEDGMFPQSAVSDSTLIANLEAGAALSGGSYVVGSVVFDGWSYDGEEYVKVTASGANGTADDSGCTWFLVEPIVWVVGYGETLPTDFSTAVSAKIVTLGAYASSSANSTFVSLYSSTLTNALLALSDESLSISVSDSITYDLFNTTASQTAVFSVNLGNATSSNTTVTSAGYRVASVNEIDALGGAYATECSDFVAFLLSGGSSASGYVTAYWTRDLAYSLAADSYYGTAHGGKAYSYDGTYNQGVYVTSDGIISNATLKNVFGARLSVSL